ncbi:hypothetical protein ACNKHR_26055 [Shigella flexneri]
MVTGQFIAHLISWGAIGARTTESQIPPRNGFSTLLSGGSKMVPMATRGSPWMLSAQPAPAICSSRHKNGQMTIYQTSGNPYRHIIMRGGKKPNYHADDIASSLRYAARV